MVEIVAWEARYGDAFARLNLEWIERYFEVEEKDREVLEDPEQAILAAGGAIWYAVRGDVVLGTVALLPPEDGVMELAKMAVVPAAQGQGLVHVPALAERPADIAPLAALFAARREKQLSARAVAVLKAYDWPGNVRELQSVVTRAATASSGETLSGRAMREALAADARPVPRDPVESRLLWETCFRHDWDMRAIARELRVSRATAYRRLNAHGVRRFRSDGAP